MSKNAVRDFYTSLEIYKGCRPENIKNLIGNSPYKYHFIWRTKRNLSCFSTNDAYMYDEIQDIKDKYITGEGTTTKAGYYRAYLSKYSTKFNYPKHNLK